MNVPLLCAKNKSNTVTSHKLSIGDTTIPIRIRCANHSPDVDENAVHTMVGTVNKIVIRYTPLRPYVRATGCQTRHAQPKNKNMIPVPWTRFEVEMPVSAVISARTEYYREVAMPVPRT